MKKQIVILILIISSFDLFSQTLDWTYKFGGSYEDNCYDFDIDSSNNIYLTGGICNTVNFDLLGGSEDRTAEGTDNSNIFVAVYNANRVLKTAFVLKSNSWNYSTDIEIDKERNICISGFYSGTIDFNPATGTFNLTSSKSHFFVAKYDSVGNFKWAKNISQKKDNWGPIRSKMYCDDNSNIYLSTPDTLCKIDQNGNILWALQTTGFAVFNGISNFYILSNSLTPWESYTYSKLDLLKIDSSGNVLFEKEIISNSSNYVNGFITYDKSGKLLINGDFWGTSTFYGNEENTILQNDEMICCIPRTSNEYPNPHEYFAKFDTLGNVIWAYDFGSNSPNPYIIETTNDGVIYIVGGVNFSADFDHTQVVSQLSNSGYGIYIAKYDSSCNFLAATQFMGGSYNDFIGDFKIYNDMTAYICGHFFNTIELNLNGGNNSLYTNPPEDNFIAKYSDFNINNFTTTNIYKKQVESKIIVYPNPSNNYLNIGYSDFSIESLSILNINGQIQILITEYDGNPIDISQLTERIYIIKIRIKDDIVIRKLIKQ